jgi:hypothetical protein
VSALQDEAIADLGDGLDPERAFADPLGAAAQARDDAVDRILADDAAFPATAGQIVAAEDRARRAGERHQHLHHARLDDFLNPVIANELAQARAHREAAQPELLFMREIDPVHRRHRIAFPPENQAKPSISANDRHFIGQSSLPHPLDRAAPVRP